jgi:hypothetical protein
VLLVYSDAAGPVVVTAHSYDAQTRLRIVQDALTQPDPHLARQVMAAFANFRFSIFDFRFSILVLDCALVL